MTEPRYARFHVRVYASNRRPETGKPVVVIAQSQRDAVSRAIDLVWSGHRQDARVYVDRVEDIDPVECPEHHASPVRQAAAVLSDAELNDALELWYRRREADHA